MRGFGAAPQPAPVTKTTSVAEEVEREKERRNFVRAAHLAAQAGFDAQEARSLQRAAVRQFIEEFRNFEGAARLISEYRMNREELHEVIGEVLASPNAEVRTFRFHKGKPTSMSLAEQVRQFAARYAHR